MKKYYLTILSVVLLSFIGNTQNACLPEDNELMKFKMERINNVNFVNEPVNYYGKTTAGIKSVQDDFGTPPNWDWVTTFGGSGKDIVREVVTSADGSLFITGSFSGEISIGSNTYIGVGRRDAFLAKFQSDGSLNWFKQFSPLADEKIDAYGINLDDQGNIYFTGYYTGDVSFGDFNLSAIHDMNMFLAVANPEGEITMATIHTTNNPLEIGLKVDIDDDGNIFVLGSTDGTSNFRHPSVIVKYSPEGTVLLDYYHSQNFCDMKIVGEHIYFIGTIVTPDYIGDFYLDPMGYNDAFVAKANTNMEFSWANMGSHDGSFSGDSYAIALHVSSDEEIFLLGHFRNEVIWGSFQVHGFGGFITKCSIDGIFLWAEQTRETESDNPTDITGNESNIFVGTNYNNQGEIIAYDASDGVMVGETNLESMVESISYSTTDNSVVVSQDADELIQLSKLDDITLNTEWSILFGGNSAWAHGIGMDVDQFGNQFNFGYASNEMDYFGQTINKGLYLAKQNPTGNPFWVVQFTDADDIYLDLGIYTVVDTNTSSVYITGLFFNPLVIPGGPTLIPNFNGSIFILKYDFNGNYQWAVQEDFISYTLCLATDNSGNVLLCGTFSNQITIGSSTLVSAGGDDVFIAKYDGNGQVVWAKRAGGESIEYWAFVSTDGQDNIYMTGEFDSQYVTVDDYPITMEEGDGNILIAKFDPQGNVEWVTVKGGSTVNSFADYYGWPTGIYTDFEGNIYIKGWCNDSSHFDNIMLTSSFTNPENNKRWNKFVARFDPSGNTVWATSISEEVPSSDYNQFDVDKNGNIYSGLRIRGDTTMFGDDFTYIKTGRYNLLVINYLDNGQLNWVKSIKDSESGSTWISSIATFDEETTYVCGWFTDYLDFGTTSYEVNNKTGFIGLLGELTGIPVYERNDAILFDLFPVPAQQEVSILLTDDSPDEVDLIITDIAGRNIYSAQISKQQSRTIIDISNFSSGVYFVKLKSGNNIGVKKLIVN